MPDQSGLTEISLPYLCRLTTPRVWIGAKRSKCHMKEADYVWPLRLTLMAAALTATVSGALFVSLIVRDSASLNVFNLASLIGTTQGAGLAFWFYKHPAIFIAGYLLFFAAVIPTTFAWIWLLYMPSLGFLTLALIIRIVSNARHWAFG